MTALDINKRFPREFFSRPTLVVARGLIGSYLCHRSEAGLMAGRIVEAEAYLGPQDKAAHTFGGRMSERNRAMFGEKGHAYIFQIYGMYWCLNCVSGPLGKPQAVLIRALEPVLGTELMHRNIAAAHAPNFSLCKGPGKLCRAMGITRNLYGEDLCGERLFLVPGLRKRGEQVGTSERINIDYAEEYVKKLWRYFLRGSKAVSGPAKYRT